MSQARLITVTANVAVVNATETVVATLPGVPQYFDAATILLEGWAQITTGGSTTAVTASIRRGTAITDTLLGEANPITIYAATGSTEERSITVVDTPGAGGPYSYVLTLTQVAGAANGNCLQAALIATYQGPSGT